MVNINETISEVAKLNPELARKIQKYMTVNLNHKLNLYVPSERVRNLFIDWLEE